ARVAQIITTYLGEIESIVDRGRKDGIIRKDIVPATAAVMFLGLILPAAVLWNVSEGKFDMITHVKNAWPAFERSIAAQTPKEG
ncbi:MAG: TetR/AcrR family transcriptional regulator, partial [Desulfobacteraceae bacterium]|nr:TetR/AcrR family transcriptional regulator [Desulfobacteraceae bacterium]